MHTPAAMVLRPALPADAGGIAAIFIQSAAHHARLDPERYHVPPVDAIAARYREVRRHAPPAATKATTIVAELDGEIVGFVDAYLDRSADPSHRNLIYCNVDELAVATGWQSRGIGGRLLRAAEDWGRRHGAAFAYLEYHADNVRAGEFYQRRMGYRVTSLAALRRL